MHGLFTCSNYPNVEARASAILVGTSKQLLLQPYVRLHMVMSATVQPKCRTYTHFRDLDNYQIEGLYFLYGRCSKGAGRTHNVIDLKFYLLLNLSFKASSPPPLPHPFNLFIDTGVILSYEMVSKCFNTFRRLDYNKIKKLRGDSFSQLVRLREL